MERRGKWQGIVDRHGNEQPKGEGEGLKETSTMRLSISGTSLGQNSACACLGEEGGERALIDRACKVAGVDPSKAIGGTKRLDWEIDDWGRRRATKGNLQNHRVAQSTSTGEQKVRHLHDVSR